MYIIQPKFEMLIILMNSIGISSYFKNMNAPSEKISPHYAVLNYRGKRMFRDHQTQIKKIVYFPAEFFLGMTVKRKLFFLLSVPQVTQRNFDFDPRAPNASSDKNLCLSHGSNHFCTKGGFRSEGRGGFSQLPKTSAEKTYLGFRK